MNVKDKISILLIPIDDRPVCYDFPIGLCSLASDINLIIPPRELLGSLKSYANIEGLFRWIRSINTPIDYTVCCLDTIAYGGLIASRRIDTPVEKIKTNINRFFDLIKKKHSKLYAFSSIMRISNNNINEEEKEYWDKYGKQIFDYSYEFHKGNKIPSHSIPMDVLDDYLETRKRNLELNKYYLTKEADFLVYSRDDTARYGLNVLESIEIKGIIEEKHANAMVISGADEIWAGLIARAYLDFHGEQMSFAPLYNHPDAENVITRYDGVSIDETFSRYLKMLGANRSENADINLFVNAPFKIQDDLAMQIFEDSKGVSYINFDRNKNYAIADVKYANGADNAFVESFIRTRADEKFFGYAAWNTTANSMGSVMAIAAVKFIALKKNSFNEENFKKLMAIRLLDDWAYQANVRQELREGSKKTIEELFSNYVFAIGKFLGIELVGVGFYFPWKRTFEIGIILK